MPYTPWVEQARNLAQNPDMEAPGTTVVVRRNMIPVPQAVAGSIPNGWNIGGTGGGSASGNSGWVTNSSPGGSVPYIFTSRANETVALNQPIWGQIQVQSDSANIQYIRVNVHRRTGNVYYTNNGSQVIVPTPIGAPQTVDLSWIATVAIPIDDLDISIVPCDSVGTLIAPAAGSVFKARRPLLSKTKGASFDGEAQLVPDADLTQRWMGTPNASMSELTGVQPAWWTGSGGNGAAIQSTRMPGVSKSIRLIPFSSTTWDFFATATIPASALAGGTFLATRYQEDVVPLGSTTRGLKPVIFSPETPSQTTVVNAAGTQDMRLDFGQVTSTNAVRLYHGGYVGSPDVWWDLTALFAGSYAGSAFSGNTPSSNPNIERYRFVGTPNASDSVRETRQFYKVDSGVRNLSAEDYLVEFRDKNLVRRGAIPAPDLQLKFQPVFNGVGTWSLTLPAEHRAVPYLRAPGSGIIITNRVTGKIEMSGPTSKPTKKATSQDPKGMVTISGLSDDCIVYDTMSWPEPSNTDVTTQQFSHDTRTGTADALIRAYVSNNIGPAAPNSWRKKGFKGALTLGPAPAIPGPTLTKSPRFQNLGDLLSEISLESGGVVAWRVVQVGSVLQLQTYNPMDRTLFIRLDISNGTLSDQNVEFAPPEVTRIVVAGQGQMTDRHFVLTSTTQSVQAEDDWGRVIEQFKDQRNTDDETEMVNSGLGILNDKGFTKVAVKATPANDMTMVFMKDFFLGDKVKVVIDGQETTSYITEGVIAIDGAGLRSAVAIGDIADFDSASALRQTVQDNTRRIEFLEKNAEAPNVDRLTLMGRGTTAERDAYYGSPVSLAQQVALANKKVVWFNTDLGWDESYYVPTGSAGLTAKGLTPGVAASWYPTGLGPMISMVPTAPFTTGGTNTPVRGWGTLGTGLSKRSGGSSWLTYDDSTGRVTMVKAGVYKIFIKTVLTNGTGTAIFHLVAGAPANPYNLNDSCYTLDSNYLRTLEINHGAWTAQAGDITYLRCWSGNLNVHMRANVAYTAGGEFLVQYVGPPLVTD